MNWYWWVIAALVAVIGAVVWFGNYALDQIYGW